ncbi:hypothetical protein EV193_105136 [Herbihabitans rhizosphaerae]|uniref:DUF3558 domain-containing protein n=1 Tax=Herbihabitans rhizosphaerae TaxID=1872711 RepID=A0A4Q7KLN7_9PSEU|nr:hypothetical protein [Herbihabitans rhizosphaerae]RZS37578.1 hypothetical protein EV193_105136 [Herbihabitans rhizosphaerae]
MRQEWQRPRSNTGLIIALVIGLVALAGIGVGLYFAVADDDEKPTAGGSTVSQTTEATPTSEPPATTTTRRTTTTPALPPDKYTRLAPCAEAAPKLPMPPRAPHRDIYQDRHLTWCTWVNAANKDHAKVEWALEPSSRYRSGAAEQRRFFINIRQNKPDAPLPFAELAFFEGKTPVWNCVLYVLDGNVVVTVYLGDKEHPSATCQAEATNIAKAAVEAIPK